MGNKLARAIRDCFCPPHESLVITMVDVDGLRGPNTKYTFTCLEGQHEERTAIRRYRERLRIKGTRQGNRTFVFPEPWLLFSFCRSKVNPVLLAGHEGRLARFDFWRGAVSHIRIMLVPDFPREWSAALDYKAVATEITRLAGDLIFAMEWCLKTRLDEREKMSDRLFSVTLDFDWHPVWGDVVFEPARRRMDEAKDFLEYLLARCPFCRLDIRNLKPAGEYYECITWLPWDAEDIAMNAQARARSPGDDVAHISNGEWPDFDGANYVRSPSATTPSSHRDDDHVAKPSSSDGSVHRNDDHASSFSSDTRSFHHSDDHAGSPLSPHRSSYRGDTHVDSPSSAIRSPDRDDEQTSSAESPSQEDSRRLTGDTLVNWSTPASHCSNSRLRNIDESIETYRRLHGNRPLRESEEYFWNSMRQDAEACKGDDGFDAFA